MLLTSVQLSFVSTYSLNASWAGGVFGVLFFLKVPHNMLDIFFTSINFAFL